MLRRTSFPRRAIRQQLIYSTPDTNMPAPPPLTVNLTFWVDSATGSDLNPGTQAQPWETLDRAFAERAKWATLNANLVVNLVGAGPYALPSLSDSACGTNGSFQLRGDITARTVHATGTLAGNIDASNVVGTSAGLGADTWAGKHLRILSGALAGAVVQILEHTDASVTVMNAYVWESGATANGNTFEIFTPTTELIVSDTVWDTCLGGSFGGDATLPASTARHMLYHVSVTGSSTFDARNSAVGLTCVSSHDVAFVAEGPLGVLSCGVIDDGARLGVGSPGNFLLYGAGLSATGSDYWQSGAEREGTLLGTMYLDGFAYLYIAYAGGPANCYLTGIRTAGSVSAFGLSFVRFVNNDRVRSMLTDYGVALYSEAYGELFHTLEIEAAYSSALLVADTATANAIQNYLTGGTSDASLFGTEVQGNAVVAYSGPGALTLTGGTAGQDVLVTGEAAVANATIGAGASKKSTVTNAIVYRA